MKVVEINFDSANSHAHEAEAFGSEAVSRVQVAFVPLLAAEGGPWVVGHSVETISERHTARSGSSLRVVVSCVDVGVVVEIFLHVHNVESLSGKSSTDQVGVGLLVTRNIIAIDDFWKTCYVVGKKVELSGLLAKTEATQSQSRDKELAGN